MEHTTCPSPLSVQRGKAGRALRMGQQLALERGVLLAKLLVNLHVFVEGSCSPELKVGSWGAGKQLSWSVFGKMAGLLGSKSGSSTIPH